MKVTALVFHDFEILDLFGPVEFLSGLPDTQISYQSLAGGPVTNRQGVTLLTERLNPEENTDVLLLPGGPGVRTLVDDAMFLDLLVKIAEHSTWLLSICTGSALLAKVGILHGRAATSNKLAFDWVKSQGEQVDWKRKARWVHDGKYYTSSGVSAGMDMTLGFIRDQFGPEMAETIARKAEYHWQDSPERDDFA